ncbi:unnamed protein product [Peniophora sp. CBMAI 1063]|nr:unnamed protein product [Peniophora sp. CBMAI 1063]
MGLPAPRKELRAPRPPSPTEESVPPVDELQDLTTAAEQQVPPKLRRVISGQEAQPAPFPPPTQLSHDAPTQTPAPNPRRVKQRERRRPPRKNSRHCMHTCDDANQTCNRTIYGKNKNFLTHIGSHSQKTHSECHPDCPGYQYLGAVAWAKIEQMPHGSA